MDAFISQRWLITVRENPAFSIEPVIERWDRSPDLAAHGVGFLLYGLLDVVVDGYFEVIQAFDEYHDLISERIFAKQSHDALRERHWFAMRRATCFDGATGSDRQTPPRPRLTLTLLAGVIFLTAGNARLMAAFHDPFF